MPSSEEAPQIPNPAEEAEVRRMEGIAIRNRLIELGDFIQSSPAKLQNRATILELISEIARLIQE